MYVCKYIYLYVCVRVYLAFLDIYILLLLICMCNTQAPLYNLQKVAKVVAPKWTNYLFKSCRRTPEFKHVRCSNHRWLAGKSPDVIGTSLQAGAQILVTSITNAKIKVLVEENFDQHPWVSHVLVDVSCSEACI